jgi:hypothetical protein
MLVPTAVERLTVWQVLKALANVKNGRPELVGAGEQLCVKARWGSALTIVGVWIGGRLSSLQM